MTTPPRTAPGGLEGAAARGEWVLEVDAAACDGHGICSLCFPEGVSLDEWGFAAVTAGPIREGGGLKRARRAVAACPEKALSLRGI